MLYFTYWTYKKFGNGGWDTLLKGIKIIYSRSEVCYIEISSSRMQSYDRFPYCKVNTNVLMLGLPVRLPLITRV